MSARRDTRDQLSFYMTLLTDPALIGLSPRAVEELRRPQQLVTSQAGDQYYFSQGLVVVEPSNSTNRQVWHAGAATCMLPGLCVVLHASARMPLEWTMPC